MIQINLLPDVKQEFLRAKRMRNTIISLSILVGMGAIGLVVVMLLLLGLQTAREKLADDAIEREYATLESTPNLSELLTLQTQLSSIGDQHNNKTITSRLFSILEIITPPDDRSVAFSTMRVTPAEHMLVLEGSTTNGYRAVEALSKTITNTKITYMRDGEEVTEPLAVSVVPGETSVRAADEGSGQTVGFEITIVVNEVLFSNQAKQLSVIENNRRIDVTDSRIGVPESLFTPAVKEGDDE